MKRFQYLCVALSAGLLTGLASLGTVNAQSNPVGTTVVTPNRGGGARGTTTAPTVAVPPASGTPTRSGAGGGFGGSARGGAGGSAVNPPELSIEGPTCALTATLYEVRMASDQIARVDIDKLNKAAATPEDFEKALAELGTARPLYHVNQVVRLHGDQIHVGSSMPYVTNSQVTSTGQIINSVAYTNVGARFDLRGKTVGANVELDLAVQISSLSEGTVKISNTVTAPYFRTIQLTRKGLAKPKQPFVVLAVDAASTDAAGKAVASIMRVVLGTPEETNSAR
jgi:hypothetical protein